MRYSLSPALLSLLISALAKAAYADDGGGTKPSQENQAAVQSMTEYKPPLQRYTVQGSQPDVGGDIQSPATQNLIYDNALSQSELFANKYAHICPPDYEKCCHFYVEAGAYVLKPHFESNPALILGIRRPVNGVPTVTTTEEDFGGNELRFTPRLSVGVSTESELLGLRTSWWHFDEGTATLLRRNPDPTGNTVISTPPIVGIPGFRSPGVVARAFGIFNDSMIFGSHLNIHVWDWAATHCLRTNGWCFLLSEGVRYTYLSQHYQVFRTNTGTGRLGTSRVNLLADTDIIGTGHNENGAGPTIAGEVWRTLGDSGFSLYGRARCSVIFARGRTASFQATIANQRITSPTGTTRTQSGTATSSFVHGHDDVMPITDLEFGVEWSHKVGPGRLYVQTGFVASEWSFAGSATSDNGDLSFIGMNLTMGWAY